MAMSEGVMTALLMYDSLTFLGVSAGISPQLKIATRTYSDTGLKQLRNDSIVVRTRPCGKCYSYLRDVCYGTLLHAPCVDPVFEPGKTQKADGLTEILGRNLQLAFMSELGMKVPSYLCFEGLINYTCVSHVRVTVSARKGTLNKCGA